LEKLEMAMALFSFSETFQTCCKNHSDDMVKVVIHEIGHTLGIPHCETNIKCLMNDAKGKGSQVKNELLWICNDCRKKIKY
jgi:archaemetzincin